jgi:hypothetical protein
MKRFSVLLLSAIVLISSANGQEGLTTPTIILDCLHAIGGSLEVRNDLNPFYLRGDFLGAGKPVYAVGIRRNSPLQVGVALCPSEGAPIVFMPGLENKFVSKDLTNPYFVAPHWEVYTRLQASDLLKDNHKMGHPVGESIAMMWEDRIGLLFFDGKKFQWIPSLQ